MDLCVPTYHARYEEKFSLTKNHSKICLSKINTDLFKMFFIISFISFFSTTVRQVLPYIIKEIDVIILVKNVTASSLFVVDGGILNQERNLG